MIVDIFFPNKIGSYVLIPKTVLGIDITKTHVYATKIHYMRHQVFVENFIEEPLDLTSSISHLEKVRIALKKISEKVGFVNEIRSSISSSIVLFKEINVPFIDREKIESILPYEIEPLIPFSLNESVMDFIITKQNTEENKTTILVAIVQKNHISDHLNFFNDTNITPTTISVDMFDLYGLYSKDPLNSQKKGGTVLIDFDLHTTRLAYLIDGQLKLIRTLPKAILALAKNLSTELKISQNEALENILRFGFHDHQNETFINAFKANFESILQEIRINFDLFTKQSSLQKIDHIVISGDGAHIHGIIEFVNAYFNIPCSLFDTIELQKQHIIELKKESLIPPIFLLSLATGFENNIIENFNLRQKEFAVSSQKYFLKQFMTGLILIFLIFASLFLHIFMQERKLNKHISDMDREVINSLQTRDLTTEKTLIKALQEASEKVGKEEELWFAFSRQSRFSFLKTLQELSSSIDKKATGLILKKLLITPNTLTIEGQVAGFIELKVLERELRNSNVFVSVPPLQELKINETLILKKNGDYMQ